MWWRLDNVCFFAVVFLVDIGIKQHMAFVQEDSNDVTGKGKLPAEEKYVSLSKPVTKSTYSTFKKALNSVSSSTAMRFTIKSSVANTVRPSSSMIPKNQHSYSSLKPHHMQRVSTTSRTSVKYHINTIPESKSLIIGSSIYELKPSVSSIISRHKISIITQSSSMRNEGHKMSSLDESSMHTVASSKNAQFSVQHSSIQDSVLFPSSLIVSHTPSKLYEIQPIKSKTSYMTYPMKNTILPSSITIFNVSTNKAKPSMSLLSSAVSSPEKLSSVPKVVITESSTMINSASSLLTAAKGSVTDVPEVSSTQFSISVSKPTEILLPTIPVIPSKSTKSTSVLSQSDISYNYTFVSPAQESSSMKQSEILPTYVLKESLTVPSTVGTWSSTFKITRSMPSFQERSTVTFATASNSLSRTLVTQTGHSVYQMSIGLTTTKQYGTPAFSIMKSSRPLKTPMLQSHTLKTNVVSTSLQPQIPTSVLKTSFSVRVTKTTINKTLDTSLKQSMMSSTTTTVATSTPTSVSKSMLRSTVSIPRSILSSHTKSSHSSASIPSTLKPSSSVKSSSAGHAKPSTSLKPTTKMLLSTASSSVSTPTTKLTPTSSSIPKVTTTTSAVTPMRQSTTMKPTTKKQTGFKSTTTKSPQFLLPKIVTKNLASFESAIKVQFRVTFPAIADATKMQIVVQKYDATFTATGEILRSWYEVRYFEDFKNDPYIAEEFTDPLLRKRTLFNFTIGNDKRCQQQEIRSQICNGPLEQGAYRFRLFYDVNGVVRKSGYSRVYTTASSKPTPKSNSTGIDQNDVTIAVIAVLAVLLVIIIIVAVILYRKKNSRRENYSESNDPECTLLSSLKRSSSCSKSCYGRRVLGVGDSILSLKNVSKGMSRPVHIKDFIAWVTRSQADSDFRFAEEFEAMRDVGRNQTHEASDMPENRSKNRYTNVLANDKTRVKLSYTDDDAGSDYINANYIHGYKHPRAYIATQGPLPGTADDFWRMIWEHNTYNVVMVTQCMERNRVKCHEYWPGTQPTMYGEITVSLTTEVAFPEWTEREFLLEVEGEECRRVRHLQYTAWPDHGVPKNANNILEFIQTMRSNVSPGHGPIVIHCSAGVGRTGTLIAIDTLINRLQDEDTIDAYLTVCLMRMQRCNMVQTEDQYIFIHRVVVEFLRTKDTSAYFEGYSLVPKDEADKYFDHLAPTSESPAANRDSGLALLLGEFETEHRKESSETVT